METTTDSRAPVPYRTRIKQALPPWLLNQILLRLPFLYRTPFVNYETNLSPKSVDALLGQLRLTLHLEGAIIECGSSRCGATAIMAGFLRSSGAKKRIYACDTFEGFDRLELARERAAGWTAAPETSFTSTSYDYVRKKLARLGLEGMVLPVKGLFRETLPTIDDRFCLGFIDCDLYDSLVYCAETIWPNLAPGGRIVFDDYDCELFQGARRGVEFFVGRHRSEIAEHGPLGNLYYVRKG